MPVAGPVGAALTSAAAPADSGSASGVISILIGAAIMVAAARWAFIARRAKNVSEEQDVAPPVQRLGADVAWWRENAGTGTVPAVIDVPQPDSTGSMSALPKPAPPKPTLPEPGHPSNS